MIEYATRKPFQPRMLLIILGIGMMPVICGALVMIQQIDRELDKHARTAAARALHVTDGVFDSLRSISFNIEHPPSPDCQSLSPRLLSATSADPLLHSLSVKTDGGLTCSSVQAHSMTEKELTALAEQGITLTSQTPTPAKDAVLIFARAFNSDIVLASIWGEVLHNQISRFSDDQMLELDFGDHSIWISGPGYGHSRPSLTLNRVTKTSTEHGYRVHAGFTPSAFKRRLGKHALQTLPLFVLIGLLTGGAAYLGMYRNQGRRSRVPQ